MSDHDLRKPTFIKLKELQHARSGYNVIVKVVDVEKKQVSTKEGKTITMLNVVVADQTACAKAFFKGPEVSIIEKDTIIAIRNGVKRIIKGYISLEIDAFGRVTKQNGDILPNSTNNISQIQIKFERQSKRTFNGPKRDNYNRNSNRNYNYNRDRDNNRGNDEPRRYNNKRYDNDRQRQPRRSDRNQDDRHARRNNDRYQNQGRRNNYNESRQYGDKSYNQRYNNDRKREDRGPKRQRDQDFDRKPRQQNRGARQYEQKRQQHREKRAPMNWVKINQIGPGEEGLNLIAKVISAQIVKGARGSNVKCVIGDQTGVVNAFLLTENQITIGSSIALFKVDSRVNKEHIQLQLGRFGRVDKSRRLVDDVNQKFNLSEKSWVAVD